MKQEIETFLRSSVAQAASTAPLPDLWRTPLVGFAGAKSSAWDELRQIAHPDHVMPQEVLPGATVVLSYFLPFSPWLPEDNRAPGLSSSSWAQAYEVTNALFSQLNQALIQLLAERGYRAAVPAEAGAFDRNKLMARWSQRHVARLAGLGTFGLNNMLITEAGCCGRFASLVTDLDVTPDAPVSEEYCLFRRNGTCGVCASRCVSGALTRQGIERQKCFYVCKENAKVYNQFGSSYADIAGQPPTDSGSEVCGKCLTRLPCTLKRP